VTTRAMTDLFSLPYVDDTHGCSKAGAEHALPKAGTQMAMVYQALEVGPLSDAQLAERLGYALSVVCARRNELVKRGLVVDAGTQIGKFGVRNTRWQVATQKI
jgi:hypothetical protein